MLTYLNVIVYTREYNNIYKRKVIIDSMVVFIQYLITILIAYLGLIVGSIISYFAKEELKPGKLYFTISSNALIAIIIAAILTKFHIAFTIIVAFAVFTYLHFVPAKMRWLYIASSVFIGIAVKDDALLIIQATFIFLLGAVFAALEYKEKDKLKQNIINIVKETYPFLVVAIILFFVMQLI